MPNFPYSRRHESGFTGQGKLRYRCGNLECDKSHFLLDYTYRAWVAGVKKTDHRYGHQWQWDQRYSEGSKDREKYDFIDYKKKAKTLVQVNPNFFSHPSNKDCEVRQPRACVEAELDEQWSFVGNKSDQRWLWHAVCHETNAVLAYVFGKRKDDVFRKLQALISPVFTLIIGELMNDTSIPTSMKLVKKTRKKLSEKI